MNNSPAAIKKLLSIDDDTDDQYLLESALNKIQADIELICVNDGESAISLLKQQMEKPDLIMLDLNMPGLSGIETLEKIRSDTSIPYIPIIIYTTSRADSEMKSAYLKGANSFVVKATSIESLNRQVAGICEYWFNVTKALNVNPVSSN